MVGVFVHLGFEVHVGVSEVGHYRPILCCKLFKVGEYLLYPNQVVGYVANLARCLLVLSEIGLGFN